MILVTADQVSEIGFGRFSDPISAPTIPTLKPEVSGLFIPKTNPERFLIHNRIPDKSVVFDPIELIEGEEAAIIPNGFESTQDRSNFANLDELGRSVVTHVISHDSAQIIVSSRRFPRMNYTLLNRRYQLRNRHR